MSLSEQTVFLIAGSLRLESLLHLASGPDAVVITHPHSLYGGEMDNPVVAMLTGVYQRLGYTTLRFNFRGVGASGGGYDDGRGEQDDVRAAAAYLAGLGRTVTDLAGYSFGAWINLRLNPPVATVRRQVSLGPSPRHRPNWWSSPATAIELPRRRCCASRRQAGDRRSGCGCCRGWITSTAAPSTGWRPW